MYLPAHFAESDTAEIKALIAASPLATVIQAQADDVLANHVPMYWHQQDTGEVLLRAHVARANPLWKQVQVNPSALAIFHGPDHYISPSWYPAKHEHGRVVPTWNYAVVHVHGRLTVHEDAAWLRAQIAGLTDRHEAAFERPWRINDAPADYIERQLAAIVGIELRVERIEAKFKLSQNHPEANRQGVVDGLAALGTAPAQAMRAAMLTLRARDR